MDRELLERLRDMAYGTGWVAGQAEAGIKQDEAYQKAKIAARNQVMETIAAQHEQEVAAVRKQTWAEAEAHFAPYVAADDASFRLFEQYSEGGGLTPAETLEKVAEVLDNLCNALAEQIDRAVAAEEENADLRRQLVELLAVVKDLAEALIATTNTLESVDPNAPSLELANEVIDKHIRVIGPLIEEARRGGEK